eukprot:TRINITY_DN5077_c0_g1_i1.p1 TRINITY_DN5077_c0_g1~~TRINITY_DN5077_c0_g1_i1.p1  ORF type:complete len:737 (-),score=135.57 TRINITY_DN5077_c0_g1_i1:18-2228(-)
MSDNTSSEMEAGTSQLQENSNDTFPHNGNKNNAGSNSEIITIPNHDHKKQEPIRLKSLAELASAKTNTVNQPITINNTTTEFSNGSVIDNAEPFPHQLQSTNAPPYEMDFSGIEMMSPMKSMHTNLYPAFSPSTPSRFLASPTAFSSPFPSSRTTTFMSPIQDFSSVPNFATPNSIPLPFDGPLVSNLHLPHFPLSSVTEFSDTPPLPSTPVSDKTHNNIISSLTNTLHTLPNNPNLPITSIPLSITNGTHKRKRSIDELQFPPTRSLNTSSENPSPTITSNTSPPQLAQPSNAKRKQCHCKNSKCLKLYCECFASRTYCQGCSCVGCMNNEANKEAVDHAVAVATERNPNAFKPKILGVENNSPIPTNGVAPSTKHSKGCHCKKSGCLKKYCECFQAGIQCSTNCKCTDCKNSEGHDKDKSQTNLSSVPTPIERTTSILTTTIINSESNSNSNHSESSQGSPEGKRLKPKTMSSITPPLDPKISYIDTAQQSLGEIQHEQVKGENDVHMETQPTDSSLESSYESSIEETANSEETEIRKVDQRETQAKFIAEILQPSFISEVCKTMLIAANLEREKFMRYFTENSSNPPNLKSNSPTILTSIPNTDQEQTHTPESNSLHSNTTTTTTTSSETSSLMCEEEVSSFTTPSKKSIPNSNPNNNNINNNNTTTFNPLSSLNARLYASQEGVVLTDLNNLLKGLLDLTRKHQYPEKSETNRFLGGSPPTSSYNIPDNNHS